MSLGCCSPVAVFIFFATIARARVVTANFLFSLDRFNRSGFRSEASISKEPLVCTVVDVTSVLPTFKPIVSIDLDSEKEFSSVKAY